MGAWIEIEAERFVKEAIKRSHPLWVRGLKSRCLEQCLDWCSVAPFMGAWIEILKIVANIYIVFVAPFMGAWIEILKYLLVRLATFRRTLYGCVD